MFCSRCGHELPTDHAPCPACETPAKKRTRQVRRLWGGLFIFLAGAIVGSLVDSAIFRGQGFDHGVWRLWSAGPRPSAAGGSDETAVPMAGMLEAAARVREVAPTAVVCLAQHQGEWGVRVTGTAASGEVPARLASRLMADDSVFWAVDVQTSPPATDGSISFRLNCRLRPTPGTGTGLGSGGATAPAGNFEGGTGHGRSGDAGVAGLSRDNPTGTDRRPTAAPEPPVDPATKLPTGAADGGPDKTSTLGDASVSTGGTTGTIAERPDPPGSSLPAGSSQLPGATTDLTPTFAADYGTAGDPTAAPDPAPAPAPPARPYRLILARADKVVAHPGQDFHATFSPDASQLVFASRRGASSETGEGDRYQAFVKPLAGGAPESRWFAWPGNVYTPELFADGQRMLFSSDSQAPEHIFVWDRRTASATRLTRGRAKYQMPALSPDGRFVAYVADEKGQNDIWVMELGDDGPPTRVTESPDDEREPRWSRDGRSLVYTRIRKKMVDSAIMRVQLEPLGAPEELVADGRRNWLPDLSPDGQWLAYVRSAKAGGSGNEIVLRRLRDGIETVVKPVAGREDFRPIWAPDGRSLLCHADSQNNRDIYRYWLQAQEE